MPALYTVMKSAMKASGANMRMGRMGMARRIRTSSLPLPLPLVPHSPATIPHRRNIHSNAVTYAQQSGNATAAPSTPASASASASTSASSSVPIAGVSRSLSALADEVRWVYRLFLRHARMLPADKKQAAMRDTARQFRDRFESSPPTAAEIQKRIDLAYSKLSFMRMATPKIYHPKITVMPPYPAARSLLGFSDVSSGSQSFVYIHGEVMSGSAGRREGDRIVNSQGVTEEQIKRHYANVDRMHFRGPYWQGKPRY